MQYVMLCSVLQVCIDICLQQLEHKRYQEKQQLLRAIVRLMDHKRPDLQGIFQDFFYWKGCCRSWLQVMKTTLPFRL